MTAVPDSDSKENGAKPEEVDTYKTPDQVTVDEIMNKDTDDVALQKYKQQLLGAANKVIDADDPRQVFFDAMVISPVDRPEIEIIPAKCDSSKVEFTLKEGCTYTATIKFRVQREIVLGLKKKDTMKRGVLKTSDTDMMGSFAPDAGKTYQYKFPVQHCPSGMMARGTYSAHTQFFDDDNKLHLEFKYKFTIAKKWVD